MRNTLNITGHVDENGNIKIPKETAAAYGLKPGSMIYIEERENYLRINQPADHLTKIYIEPTNQCNLGCRTCVRNVWDEPQGSMSGDTFSKIMDGLKEFSPAPSIFFGGLGEPLTHPDIIEMVKTAKSRGSNVEIITNGTLLSKEISKELVYAGLDMIWISLDGATPESYADVRLGAELPKVLGNIRKFHKIRLKKNITGTCAEPGGYRIYEKPYIGIVFVAMKRNIKDLPDVLSIASSVAASRVLVSNLLPYTKEMSKEILYTISTSKKPSFVQVDLPLMETDGAVKEALYKVATSIYTPVVYGAHPSEMADRCPFIEKGSLAISWNGDASPCLPLLHSYNCYVYGKEHFRKKHTFGNISQSCLKEIWELPDYASFRDNVKRFDFSPCDSCGGCDLAEDNETDCMGSAFPTCGNCLWAQGLIRCP